ncbi:MAG: hypothetical protein V1869_01955 [Candidatus Omnitrophota bacterium]
MNNSQLPGFKKQLNSRIRIPNIKFHGFGARVIVFCLFSGYCSLATGAFPVYAQEEKGPKELTRCACEGKPDQDACLIELKDLYFKDNKYTDFVDVLKGACPGNKASGPIVDYYIALSRYSQLKYLEDAKSWDEYFAKGNDYRQDIVDYAQKAISGSAPEDAANVYSRLLLYQFHKDQQDSFSESSLDELMNAVTGYAQSNGDIKVIKEAADKLAVYNEKGKSKELYKVYAQKLAGSSIKDAELKGLAASFYKDANIELAETVYDIYIERVSGSLSKEKLLQELTGIAQEFAYSLTGNGSSGADSGRVPDPLYAEKVFKKIEEIGGKKAFDENLMYLRGFNLEKAKAFAQAKDIYVEFSKDFPKSAYSDEVVYKTGIIFIYALRDLKSGTVFLEQLARKDAVSPHVVSSLYQLGLLKQWQGDFAAAKEYYNAALEKIGSSDPEGLAAIRERLNEIAQNKPLEYNLKIGLDAALKDEFANLDMVKVNLRSSSYLPEKSKEVDIAAAASLGPTGCLQVELQYLWSGDLGLAKPAISQSEFRTSYGASGTKLINLVLVSPEGITERDIDLIDVR